MFFAFDVCMFAVDGHNGDMLPGDHLAYPLVIFSHLTVQDFGTGSDVFCDLPDFNSLFGLDTETFVKHLVHHIFKV